MSKMAKRSSARGGDHLRLPARAGKVNPAAPELEHIWKLLTGTSVPPLTAELARVPLLEGIHHEILALRRSAESLQSEISQRNSTVIALQEREYRFRYMATHDSLTGAMNRASFMERAIRELRSAFSTGSTCGVVMMDIDHFKRFNDTWGHMAGDEALRFVVNVVSSTLRKNDFMGRYGGEEFVFFFGGADQGISVSIAERIREAIASNPVHLESGPVSITASFGVAVAGAGFDEFPGDEYIDQIINNADMAMYQAKKAGRNRVVCFPEGDRG
ncbi:MAG: GGDEF domain-containing protein [Treponema sp.]|jgi:diguanylate cyclase (GGDEF)-like protein|nr:GGDEF domain-containing protein [Treponema sp.]